MWANAPSTCAIPRRPTFASRRLISWILLFVESSGAVATGRVRLRGRRRPDGRPCRSACWRADLRCISAIRDLPSSRTAPTRHASRSPAPGEQHRQASLPLRDHRAHRIRMAVPLHGRLRACRRTRAMATRTRRCASADAVTDGIVSIAPLGTKNRFASFVFVRMRSSTS